MISKILKEKLIWENVNSKDFIDTFSESNPNKNKSKELKCDQKSYLLWKLETKFIAMFMLRGNK